MNIDQDNRRRYKASKIGLFPRVKQQRGAVALVITLILVVVASLSSLVVNKSAINEQKRSGINLRNKEVYAAANGALEYGIAQIEIWYTDGDDATPDWAGVADELVDPNALAGDTATSIYDPDGDDAADTLAQGIDDFGLLGGGITYTLLTDESAEPAIIEVSVTVAGQAESHVTKTLNVRVARTKLGTPSAFQGPALIVEDCIAAGAILGTPDIQAYDVAIASITGDSDDTTCIDPGNFSFPASDQIAEEIVSDSLFEAMFGTVANDQAIQDMALESADVYFVTDTSPWSANAGDSTHPVILYFDETSECPSINGGAIIYGLVYYDTPAGGCANPGTGNAKIFGTMAFEGDLKKFNANIEITQTAFGGGPGDPITVSYITPLPGSWRDF
ncbi:MAG: hypothetical protein KBT88_14190 [Gammaproteobacteria bacterium]|nr:hypothetical protein [Gammaproteobacteria bacterium]MBQ0840932.1 hypothetical protein [Gammaproteobacteria bacterium]